MLSTTPGNKHINIKKTRSKSVLKVRQLQKQFYHGTRPAIDIYANSIKSEKTTQLPQLMVKGFLVTMILDLDFEGHHQKEKVRDSHSKEKSQLQSKGRT